MLNSTDRDSIRPSHKQQGTDWRMGRERLIRLGVWMFREGDRHGRRVEYHSDLLSLGHLDGDKISSNLHDFTTFHAEQPAGAYSRPI
jgi:hypothetical protein